MSAAISELVLTNPPQNLRCKVAVIGAGPGGSVTACVLAEAGLDVLLIEEGPYLELESCTPFSQEEMVQKYRNGGLTAALGSPKVQYVEGRCVGGGSEINSGLYYRTPQPVLERWRREFQVDDLEDADLIPHFEECETAVNICYLPGKAPPASLKLYEGAVRMGWQAAEVPRWFKYDEPVDPEAVPKGTKQSMTKTFVPRAVQAGCRLLPNTRIRRLRQEGDSWMLSGYLTCHARRPIQIQADTVFVCGGAVQTPALLRRSGITHNIGNSFRLHPTVKLMAQFPEVINAADMGVPVHQVKEFAPRFSFGCSISSYPYLKLGMVDHPDALPEVDAHWQQMGIYYAMITGEGRGTVRTLPGFQDPLVRYQLTDQDMKDLSEALHKLAISLFEAGAEVLYPSITNGPRFTRPEEVAQLPEALPRSRTNLMTIHLFSSCPMGENKDLCATDSFGRVHGFDNLYIADASLLCTAPGVNPQGSIMAIARRNTLRFLGK